MSEVILSDHRSEAALPHRGGRWQRASRVLWRDVSTGVLVLGEGREDPFLLSGAGSVVWHLLAEPMEFGDACLTIAAEHGVPLESTERELATLLDQMVALDLVVRTP